MFKNWYFFLFFWLLKLLKKEIIFNLSYEVIIIILYYSQWKNKTDFIFIQDHKNILSFRVSVKIWFLFKVVKNFLLGTIFFIIKVTQIFKFLPCNIYKQVMCKATINFLLTSRCVTGSKKSKPNKIKTTQAMLRLN